MYICWRCGRRGGGCSAWLVSVHKLATIRVICPSLAYLLEERLFFPSNFVVFPHRDVAHQIETCTFKLRCRSSWNGLTNIAASMSTILIRRRSHMMFYDVL